MLIDQNDRFYVSTILDVITIIVLWRTLRAANRQAKAATEQSKAATKLSTRTPAALLLTRTQQGRYSHGPGNTVHRTGHTHCLHPLRTSR